MMRISKAEAEAMIDQKEKDSSVKFSNLKRVSATNFTAEMRYLEPAGNIAGMSVRIECDGIKVIEYLRV